jgi:hypothetical protein
LPFLHKTEPELDIALQSLEGPGEVSLDLQVVDALLSLSAEIRQLDASGLQLNSPDAHRALQSKLAQYPHPKLVSFYFSWLPYHTAQSPDYLIADLQAMLGVQWSPDQLQYWWQQQAQNVTASFNLQDPQDQNPVALYGKVFGPTQGGGGFLLEPTMKQHTLYPMGGHVPGLEATATLELFQLDHYPDGKDLWRAQWPLGPIKLRDKQEPGGNHQPPQSDRSVRPANPHWSYSSHSSCSASP